MKATNLSFAGQFSQLVNYLKNSNNPDLLSNNPALPVNDPALPTNKSALPAVKNETYELTILKRLIQIGEKDSSFVNAHFDTKTIMSKYMTVTKQEFYGCLFFNSLRGADFELVSSGFCQSEAEMFASLELTMAKRLAPNYNTVRENEYQNDFAYPDFI